MLGLKADAYDINNSGDGQYAFFSDVSTRALQSVRVGESAGKISQGSANTFVGYETGKENKAGSYGVFVGFQAGQLNQSGNLNTFVGAYAGRENNRGDRNTFVGYQAGAVNRDGDECTGVGAFALRENTTGNKNVAVGNRAGERILDGDGNTMIGVEAGQDIRSGTNNTMSGYRSGRGSFKGNENTYFGAFSGYSNSLGDGNAFVGYKAGEYLTVGNFNVAVGAYALQKASYGSCNIAIGAFAGSIISGSGNVFVGTGAGASNPAGENNTNVGNNAGFEGSGTDNVYIGKNAAYSLDGNRNVVIGVNAMNDIETTGSVVIGYNVANKTFQRGNCNVFIGLGADAYTADNSYAIAIGAQNTRAYTHSISIGENIDTAGVNSISVGYRINADADQCVGVGNSISVNSAEVFNDPLNYRFPVNLTEAYNTFYLTENYTDTLYLNNTSNTIAIATIDNSNLYDSGNNTLKGTTQTQDINLRTLFSYGVFYQGPTLQYANSPLSFNYDDVVYNNITTLNFFKTTLTVETVGSYNVASNLAAATLTVPFNGVSLPFLTNVNSNLIPVVTPRFALPIATPKRQALYQIETSNSRTIIRPQEADEVLVDSQVASLDYYTYVYQPPRYGFMDSNLEYQTYPETLFNSNDRYTLVAVNQLTNTHPTDVNTYGLVSDNLYHQDYIRYPTPILKTNPIIYIHPGYSNRLDPSYFFYLPTSNIPITVTALSSNLIVSSPNFYEAPFLTINNPNSNVTETLRFSTPNEIYDYTVVYTCNIVAYDRSNITLSVLPFSMNNYTVPISPGSNALVYRYPQYGNININNSIVYTPTQINFSTDRFTLLIQYSSYQHRYVDVFVETSNLFNSVLMHKMQEPPQITTTNRSYSISEATVQSNVLYTAFTTALNITGTPVPVNTPAPFTNTIYNVYTEPYTQSLGYRSASNEISNYAYTRVDFDPNDPRVNIYPTPNQLSNDIFGVDYVRYWPVLPRVNYRYFHSNEPTPYYQFTCNLTTAIDERYFNNLDYNRYFLFDKSLSNDTYYGVACNITVFNSNVLLTYTTYNDLYNQFIYTRETSNFQTLATSNFQLMVPTTDPRYTVTRYEVTTLDYITSNIPTVQLQDTLAYQRNGSYQLLRPQTNSNLRILQKNRGDIAAFHQSNISAGEIHIWNRLQTLPNAIDNLATVYFANKQLNIMYHQNSETTYSPTGESASITYDNQTPGGQYLFGIDSGGGYTRVVIQHTSNVSFRNASYQPVTGYNGTAYPYPVPNLGYSNDVFVDYINIDPVNELAHKPRRVIVPTVYRKSKLIPYNVGLSAQPIQYITSNELYHSPNETYTVTTTTGIELKRNNQLLNVSDTFTQADINSGLITVQPLSSTQFTLTTNESITYSVREYAVAEFPASNVSGCNVLLQLKDTYEHFQFGPLWDFFRTNSNIDVTWQVLQQPQRGFLATSNGDVINHLSFSNLNQNPIYYIPYNSNIPHSLSNDYYIACFNYKGNLSPPYQIEIKNYWSRWSNIDVLVNNDLFYAAPGNATFYTSNLPRSAGAIQDNLVWSPASISIPYNTSNTVTLSLNYLSKTIDTPIRSRPFTIQPTFTTSTNQINVDNTNYVYLDSLLATTTGTMFYITQPPTQGVILTRLSTNQFQAYPYFTRQALENKQVFYQHYGLDLSQTSLVNDLFIVKVATTPFDLSQTSLSNIVTVSEAPKLLVNNYDYIFYPTIAAASNSYNLLDTNKLDISKGYLYAYETSNIELYIKNGTTYTSTVIITDDQIQANQVYYRPSSNLFSGGVNKNEPMSMTFILSSNVNNFETNPLSVYSQYQNLFNQSWFSKLNTYESVNVIQSQISSNQSISYTRFVNTASNISFANKKCQFEFEYLPFQTDLVNPTYIDFIQTYYYSFELLDQSNQALFKAVFTHSNITVTASNTTILSTVPTIPFDSLTWNSFSIINYDSLNNNALSIYINGTNYTYNASIPSLDLTNLKQIKINVPITDPLNYYNVTQTSNIAPNTNVYYNLINYNTQLRFRNFNIFLGTVEVDANIEQGAADQRIYNIALGNQLNIRGINNICLGKEFRTTGKNSIILGSEIGVQKTGEAIVNEIFNSIVISNNSFTNSKVRDVIAIGNNVMNDITVNIEDFLSKKPVLIGNNIDSSKIDFHVNFQNTFLKTTVDTPQIYCGLEGEHVCIGYTSNAKIDNANRLHVQGGAEIYGPIQMINGGQRITRTVFGNLLFTSGTSHTTSTTITWSNTQTSDYSAFSISGKFRCINNDTSYAYRRFEIFLTPKNDANNSKPGALSDLEIASYSTTDITNLSHTIERDSERSIRLIIAWNTLDALTPSNYIQASLEVEVSTPVSLGQLTIT